MGELGSKILENGIQNENSFNQLIDKVKSLPYDLNKLFRTYLLDHFDAAMRRLCQNVIAISGRTFEFDLELLFTTTCSHANFGRGEFVIV